MIVRKHYTANLSSEAQETIKAFNAICTADEQCEVVDILYDAMYERIYTKILEERIVKEETSRVKELERQTDQLRTELDQARKTIEKMRGKRVTEINTVASKAERQAAVKELQKEKYHLEFEQVVDTLKRENNLLRNRLRAAAGILRSQGMTKDWLSEY